MKLASAIIVCILLCFFKIVYSQNTKDQSVRDFEKEVINFSTDSALVNASVSFYAIDLNTGELIGQINPNLLLSPASTMKLFSTGAALEILGPEYTFQTTIEYSGTIEKDSILNGNIYIKGGGDPVFYSNSFKKFYAEPDVLMKAAKEMKKAGIKTIKGSVVGDATYYKDNAAPSTWIISDVANYYGASPFALSFMDNEYRLFFKTGNTSGDSTWIKRIEPDFLNLSLLNKVISKDIKDDQSVIYGGPYDDYRMVNGSLPLNKESYEVKGSMPDPAKYAASCFDNVLNQNGIKTDNSFSSINEFKLTTNNDVSRKLIYTITSPQLKEIIYYTNIRSVNLYAEHLLRQISMNKTGIGSNSNGTEVLLNFWKPVTGNFLAFDGSGLSRFNAVSSKQLVAVLTYMKKRTKNFEPFYNSLPVASRSGSISGMFSGTFAENNLRAKSGYMSGVRSYAGYVKTKNSKEIAFAIIVNNYTSAPSVVKKKIEQLLVKLSLI